MPYKTPGVYVEETSALPRSVAEVSTAVPAFIGYTKIGPRTAEGAKIARVSSLLEYEETFGGGKPTSFTATTTKTSSAETLIDIVGGPHDSVPEFLMYYGVKHYFQNGGGPCYIVSIGTYEDGETPDEGAFTAGLTLLEKEDEPTLILLTDAIRLITDPAAAKTDAEKLETRKKRYAGYYGVCQTALAQCEKLRDRFVILDVPGGDWEVLRDTLSENLSFGAAYHPYLQTTQGFYYDESDAEDDTPIAKKLRETKSSNTALHAQIRTKLAGMRVVLPPAPPSPGSTPRSIASAASGRLPPTSAFPRSSGPSRRSPTQIRRTSTSIRQGASRSTPSAPSRAGARWSGEPGRWPATTTSGVTYRSGAFFS